MGPSTVPRKKIAIIGGGSSGIAALWALNRTPHDVYIYEAGDQLGKHTDAVEFKKGKYRAAVDTGFILNTTTHSNFFAFLKTIGVETERTEMTTSISRDEGLFEWAAKSSSAIFAQRQNALNPRVWRMLFDIVRFNQFALDLLKEEEKSDILVKGSGFRNTFSKKPETIGEYLDREGYSDAFRDDYLIPTTSTIWNSSPDTGFEDFPAKAFVQFMWQQDLLKTFVRKSDWRTITQGAKSYIEAVMRGFPPNHILLNSAVESVTSKKDGKLLVTLENESTATYDHVIIATHAEQAIAFILPEASPEEREVLSGFESRKNVAILHSDISLMPKHLETWASSNYITKSTHTSLNIDKVCLTYNMNLLQHIPVETFGDILVTLNPLHTPNLSTIQGRYSYSQTLYTASSIRSQSLLHKIQNVRGLSYCGSWTEPGFQGDGFTSGLKIAQEHLGAKLPFKLQDTTSFGNRRPAVGLLDLFLRLLILIVQFFILLAERAWDAQAGVRRDVERQMRGRVKQVHWKGYKVNGLHKSKH